jgi:hypothetical protein
MEQNLLGQKFWLLKSSRNLCPLLTTWSYRQEYMLENSEGRGRMSLETWLTVCPPEGDHSGGVGTLPGWAVLSWRSFLYSLSSPLLFKAVDGSLGC